MHLTFQEIIFAFALAGRIGDILTTWLVTPQLKLEANPLMRKFRWPFAGLTLLIAFIAFPMPEMGVVIATVSFMVAASNAMRIPTARIMGEDRLYEMALDQAAAGALWPGLLWRLAPAPFYSLLAALMFFFFRTPDQWGYYIALGIALYILVYVFYGSLAYSRLRRIALARVER
jgi:hypothetical protein